MVQCPIMSKPRHYSFDRARFERVVAHDGEGEIETCRVLRAADGTAYNFIDLTVMPPQTTIGLHSHSTDNEEIYVVLSGQGEMTVDGETIEVAAGHVIVNRPGGSHGLRNTGKEELRLVVVEAPSHESTDE